ncbi:MAG: hypothetical protein AB4426_15045 [Xenococcaceae cyanobacterium]
MSVTIEQDLKEYLARFETKLDDLAKDVNGLKIEVATVKTKVEGVEKEITGLKDDIKDIKSSQKNQIWALIGILGTALVGTVLRFILTAIPPTNP